MNSLPSVEQCNYLQFQEVVRKLDPELYLIKRSLDETGINPMIIPRFVRALYNLAIGTGYGKVQVFMQKGVITSIKSEEADLIDRLAMETFDK